MRPSRCPRRRPRCCGGDAAGVARGRSGATRPTAGAAPGRRRRSGEQETGREAAGWPGWARRWLRGRVLGREGQEEAGGARRAAAARSGTNRRRRRGRACPPAPTGDAGGAGDWSAHWWPWWRCFAPWLSSRFALSHRDVEELLAERGVRVSDEAIRPWCRMFGPAFAMGRRRRRAGREPAGTWTRSGPKIRGQRHWLWRAVDRAGLVLGWCWTSWSRSAGTSRQPSVSCAGRSDGEAVAPRVVVTDTLASPPPALRRVLPGVERRRHTGVDHRAESSHRAGRKRERSLQRLQSPDHAQRFLEPFSAVGNHSRPRRHLLPAQGCRQAPCRTPPAAAGGRAAPAGGLSAPSAPPPPRPRTPTPPGQLATLSIPANVPRFVPAALRSSTAPRSGAERRTSGPRGLATATPCPRQ